MIDTVLSYRARRARRLSPWLAGLALAAPVLGCISLPTGPAPMCRSNSDCDHAHGEVCEESVCWGNPPPGPFAAVVSPPSTRHDLVSREVPDLIIPDFGWMGDMALQAPVQLTGSAIAFCPSSATNCDSTPLGATVTVARRSQFQGGPDFQAIANSDPSTESFTLSLPPTGNGDDPYTVTIAPATGPQPGSRPPPATLVPPLRLEMSVPQSITARPFTLGGLDLSVLQGTLTDVLGDPLVGYRVAALGRWDPTESATIVSTIATTDATGHYAVTLSAGLAGTVEISARPPDGIVAPILHATAIPATASSTGNDIVQPLNLGSKTSLTIQVTGADLSGTISPIPGAVVTVSGAVTKTLSSFTISDQQITDQTGTVTLHLLDGTGISGTYRLSVIPPAGSTLGVVFNDPVGLSQVTLIKRLSARIALQGSVVDASGKPLSNVAVTARPSLRFLWTLDAAPQAFVGAIPAATTVTPDTGEFVLWVDPNVAQIWGDYDLLIEPPAAAQQPSYVQSDVQIPRDGMLDAVTLGKVALPDAAFVHGRVVDPNGQSVSGAEIKLYQISTTLSLCSQVAHAPSSCPIPAQLLGRNTSDDGGTVRLALPR